MLYRDAFPIFKTYPELVYLDNAATSQKPEYVIDGVKNYYRKENGSPHRGAHKLSVLSTDIYNQGREAVRAMIHAASTKEIIFTRNATEALNMIAYSYLEHQIKPHQNMVLSITNHHSNILPFQRLAQKKHIELRYLYCNDEGIIADEELDKIDHNTIMVSLPYISNGLGIKHDIKKIFDKAQSVKALKVLDAAQAVGHEQLNVNALQADLLVFSGHKMYAPQGIGVLYGRLEILEKFEPFLSGGDMIEYVEEQSSTYADLPERLEAGTQNVAGVMGLIKSIEFIDEIGIKTIKDIEANLTKYAYEKLSALDYIEVYGPKKNEQRGALITFNVKEVHPHDVASILDHYHVAIRAGHHCCQPLMKYLKTASTCRASFSFFNTESDVDQLIKALEAVKEVFYE